MKGITTSLSKVVTTYPQEEGSLIPLLQQAQATFGFISLQSIEEIADYLSLTESQVYGVASFYAQFRFTEPGRHSISICLGTACHVSGGEVLLDTCVRDLNVKPGESTQDRKFDLNRVACLGCCA